MPLPGAPHTFALENCRDVLSKLEWEIAGIGAEDAMPDLAFRAFNCAVTAWHLSDWVWKALGRRRRRWGNDEEKFKADCRDQCPALRHCWLIANASKHGGIDIKRKQIETTVLAEEPPRPFRVGEGRAGDPLVEYRWRITVGDRQQSEQDALDVFEAALNFWTSMIYRERLE